MQVQFLMTHPVYPASVGCDLPPQTVSPAVEHSSWSSRRFSKNKGKRVFSDGVVYIISLFWKVKSLKMCVLDGGFFLLR